MAGKRIIPNTSRGTTPSSMPEGTPELAYPTDHSWTLQAVMDLNKTVGVLGEKIDRLAGDINSQNSKIEEFSKKIDKISHWQSLVTGGAIVAATCAAIVWAFISFIPWDRVHFDIEKSQVEQKNK